MLPPRLPTVARLLDVNVIFCQQLLVGYNVLSKKLYQIDVERCKTTEEADRQERADEIRREERPGPSTSACSRRASRTS